MPNEVAHLLDYTQLSQLTLWSKVPVFMIFTCNIVPCSVVVLSLSFLHCSGSHSHYEPGPCYSGASVWSLSFLTSSGCPISQVTRITCWASSIVLSSFDHILILLILICSQLTRGFLIMHSKGRVKVVWIFPSFESKVEKHSSSTISAGSFLLFTVSLHPLSVIASELERRGFIMIFCSSFLWAAFLKLWF